MRRLSLALSFLLLAAAAPNDPLPRQAGLGVALRPAPAGENGGQAGVEIQAIADPKLASALGLRQGDVLLRMEGQPVTSVQEVLGALAGKRGGDAARLEVRRGEKTLTLTGRYAPRPREAYRNGTAAYGAVPFQGGLLRDIFVTPAAGAQGPVVFLLQGYTCDSMEALRPDSSHHMLFDGLLARGISIYRVEKPQAGDSRGGPSCRDIDFETEMAAFQAGYRTLIEKHGVQPDRVFLLGHSMGGIEAPVLAARGPAPRGVAIFGAVARNWADYMLDVVKYQPFLAQNADPTKSESDGEALRDIIYRVFVKGETPSAVAAESPENARLLRDGLNWDGGNRLYDRHYRFWQQLSAARLLTAWRDTRSNVLSVYGESDFAAINDEDHKLIADAVNHYRAGTARFLLVPRTGHGMTLDGTREEARAAAAGTESTNPKFNSDLIALFGDWVEESMRTPPVATRFPEKSAAK